MADYEDIDKGTERIPTYTVSVTLIDGGVLTYTNSTGAEPKLSFILIGFEDHTVILPDHRIQVVTIKRNQGETK